MKTKKNFHDFMNDTKRDDIFSNLNEFDTFINDIKERKKYAFRRTLLEGSTSNVDILNHDGSQKKMIMMSSNNYLDMATDPRVVKGAEKALQKYGYGSGSVSLLAGTFEIHRTLSKQISNFYTREDTIIYPTGYSANIGVISALMKKDDLILMDTYSHASLIDGTKMTESMVKFFKHNDMKHLEKLLERLRSKFGGVLIITDGVFSMDGDVCNLPKLLELKKKYNARILIDEAHGVGVIGKTGRGTEEYFNKIGEVDIISGTLSKAPAGLGGYITGSSPLIEYLRHFANSYIFSTSLPPAVIGGLIEVFSIFCNDQSRMHMLHKNITLFSGKLRELGFDLGNSCTAIVPIIIGDDEVTYQMSHELAELGIMCSAVVFPAVSKTQARLRISLMATHTKDEINFVLEKLEILGKEHGVIS